MNKMCYKYSTKHGVVRLKCCQDMSKEILIEPKEFYLTPENITHCPFCGRLLFEYGYMTFHFQNEVSKGD